MYFFKKTHNSFWNSLLPFLVPVQLQTVFSITNALWTDEKSRFIVETTKAVIVTKTHFEEFPCNDFYALISINPNLLQEIRSSTKYKTSAREERTHPSTLTGNSYEMKFCKY
jgi:hypothetical protein